jgi:hypothetical protein
VPWHEEFPRDIYELAQRDSFDAGVLRYGTHPRLLAAQRGASAHGTGTLSARQVRLLRRGISLRLLAGDELDEVATGVVKDRDDRLPDVGGRLGE